MGLAYWAYWGWVLLFTVLLIISRFPSGRGHNIAYACLGVAFLVNELPQLLLVIHAANVFMWQPASTHGIAYTVSCIIPAILVFLFFEGHIRTAGAFAPVFAAGHESIKCPSLFDFHHVWRSLAMYPIVSSTVRRKRNIIFATPEELAEAGDRYGKFLKLDVYTSTKGGINLPVFLFFHGGGWAQGSKEEGGLTLCSHLAANGFVCVNANYRYHSRPTVTDGLGHPAHLRDCKRAIRWVRANIREYGGDPDSIVVSGGSAGGHLAALTALTANQARYQPGFENVDTTVKACVVLYAVYDPTDAHHVLGKYYHQFMKYVLMRVSMRDNEQLWKDASPYCCLHKDAPPFMVLHGNNDNVVPIIAGHLFRREFERVVGRPLTFVELPNGVHAFDLVASPRTLIACRGVESFLKNALKMKTVS